MQVDRATCCSLLMVNLVEENTKTIVFCYSTSVCIPRIKALLIHKVLQSTNEIDIRGLCHLFKLEFFTVTFSFTIARMFSCDLILHAYVVLQMIAILVAIVLVIIVIIVGE